MLDGGTLSAFVTFRMNLHPGFVSTECYLIIFLRVRTRHLTTGVTLYYGSRPSMDVSPVTRAVTFDAAGRL